MTTLYLDCAMGAAGDMLAGALLELLPDPAAAVRAFNGFGIPGVAFARTRVEKCGLAATHLSVTVHGHEEHEHAHDHDHAHHEHHAHHAHRQLADVLAIVDALALTDTVKAHVRAVYQELAAAESRAHGCAVGDIHFHEVGAADAIADIAAVCWLMNELRPDEVVASPVHVGSGTVRCAHGELPVPAPATAFLLEGVPTYADGAIRGELCTPTGAALLKHFVQRFAPQPLLRTTAIGAGAGRKDFPRANVVRALFGESGAGAAADDATMVELTFTVDDMTGEELAFAHERLVAAGARDVVFAPVLMKKGRPGQLVIVLAAPAEKDDVVAAIFRHTSTLGLRETRCRRHVLARAIETVTLADGTVCRRKVATGAGVRRAKWEADDVAAVARKDNLSLGEAKMKIEEGANTWAESISRGAHS